MNISSTSTPAGILIPASCCQVATGSLQAWTSNDQAPSAVRRHPGASPVGDVGVLRPSAPARRRRRRGRSGPPRRRAASWPSRNTVRRHRERLADGRLRRVAGRDRPRGVTSRMGIRPTMLAPFRIADRTQGDGRRSHPARRASRGPSAYRRPREREQVTMGRRVIGSIQVIGYRPPVRAIRRFTVRPVLPEPLAALGELAGNLRWSWHPRDPGPLRRGRPAAVGGRRPRPGAAARRRRAASGSTSWPRDEALPATGSARRAPTSTPTSPASAGTSARPATRRARARSPTSRPEFGITAVLPQYSGGLGILAGDHLKAASDLGVPIVGVGLLYRHGYFRQSLSREGWQQETYPVLDPDELPISLLREADGARAHDLDRACPAAPTCWPGSGSPRSAACRCCCSTPTSRRTPTTTATSPTGCTAATTEHRLRQEMLLGIGGVRALRAYSPAHRRPRRPRSSTPTRATPASSASSGSASSPSRTTARARLRRPRSRSSARRHRLHHPHAGAGRHRPVPARPGRAVLRRRQRRPPASRSTGSSRSAPRTTTAATRPSSTWR